MTYVSDLRTLKAFVTVARDGNVTQAAKRLRLTQPAVTLQLKRLAADTGITLFHRRSTGMELTPEGALLVAKAEHVLGALMDFNKTAAQLATRVRGKLKIGTVIDPEFTRLGALLKTLIESGVDIETTLRHCISGSVPEELLTDELDVSFFLGNIRDFDPTVRRFDEGNAGIFYSKELAKLTYCVVAPPSLASFVRGADWSQLVSLPWIGTPPASVQNRLLVRLFAELNLRQNVVAQADQEASMIAMVRTGVGLSLCRESTALHEQQTQGLVIADGVRISTALSFVCLETRSNDPVIVAAFEAVKRVWIEHS
ncbi:MAG: LysR family transcriptional regulator [Candidimonas sp.]